MSLTIEDVRKIQEQAKRKRSYEGITERYYDDILTYLASKWPELPKHEIQEAAVYATNRMTIAMSDTIAETNRRWKEYNDKMIHSLQKTKRTED